MSLFHHRHKIEYAFRREVNELYASLTVKNIAFRLITIFEPIYFYLFFDKEILPVLWYFGLVYLGFGLVSPLAGKILSRIGIKHSILISVFFAILYFIGLRSLTTYSSLIYVIPFLSILYKLFFWPAFHLDFARFSQGDRRARQVSILKMITLASGILSPFVGGLIIFHYGYSVLFIIVVVLLFTSVFPLFLSKEVYNTFHFSMKDFFRSLFKPALRRTEIALVAWGVEELAASLVWPIFIFLIIADYSVIGGITSAATVVAFLSAYWIGRLADKKGRRKV
ncbi:MFS transporter [Patescibacteria group bacterium]